MHKPVLLKETVEYLNPKSGDTVLDATIDGGGHAEEILKIIDEKGRLIGIEQDAVILEKLESRMRGREFGDGKNIILINGNFRDLDKLIEPLNIKKINGALFDLGMSSLQLEESGRGFTFLKNEPLLMTYKSDITSSDLTARDIINSWSEEDIADILFKYGEERYSRRIAKAIIEEREKKSIDTTFDLKGIIEKSVPPNYRYNRRINCATKSFQALRIMVNDELNALSEGLKKSWELLSGGSRTVVISFHSLEDRIVKKFFKEKAKEKEGMILTKKPITSSEKEQETNPRSRSAKLRAIEKIK